MYIKTVFFYRQQIFSEEINILNSQYFLLFIRKKTVDLPDRCWIDKHVPDNLWVLCGTLKPYGITLLLLILCIYHFST